MFVFFLRLLTNGENFDDQSKFKLYDGRLLKIVDKRRSMMEEVRMEGLQVITRQEAHKAKSS